MAAAPGNQYAAKARKWTQAIERALEKRSLAEQRDALDDLALVLLEQALKGEQWALKELGDRLEGKPAQSVALTGEDGGPIKVQKIERVIVDPCLPYSG
jgi:hypothetical protein